MSSRRRARTTRASRLGSRSVPKPRSGARSLRSSWRLSPSDTRSAWSRLQTCDVMKDGCTDYTVAQLDGLIGQLPVTRNRVRACDEARPAQPAELLRGVAGGDHRDVPDRRLRRRRDADSGEEAGGDDERHHARDGGEAADRRGASRREDVDRPGAVERRRAERVGDGGEARRRLAACGAAVEVGGVESGLELRELTVDTQG